jgi:hypothetical protein
MYELLVQVHIELRNRVRSSSQGFKCCRFQFHMHQMCSRTVKCIDNIPMVERVVRPYPKSTLILYLYLGYTLPSLHICMYRRNAGQQRATLFADGLAGDRLTGVGFFLQGVSLRTSTYIKVCMYVHT